MNRLFYYLCCMELVKDKLYQQEDVQLAKLAKALAHPARVAIIKFLLKQKACVCRIIVDEIGLAQATISQHLKVLKNAGLIQGTVEGTSVCYCIDYTALQQLLDLFDGLDLTTSEQCC